MASDGNDNDKVEIIKPSTKLKNKVGGGPNGKFNPKVIERTERAVAARGKDYTAKVKKDVQDLRALVESLKPGSDTDPELIHKIAMAAREIKGEAATFNFPLLTRFGDGLFNFTEKMTVLSPKRIAVMQAHVDAMSAVLAHSMHGDGGPVGNQLVRGLDKAIDKFKQE